jgi:hypothetical protein
MTFRSMWLSSSRVILFSFRLSAQQSFDEAQDDNDDTERQSPSPSPDSYRDLERAACPQRSWWGGEALFFRFTQPLLIERMSF